MSVEEELHEGAEHAKEPFDRKVAVTMAIIAAMLAIVSVLGHILSTEELLAQQKARKSRTRRGSWRLRASSRGSRRCGSKSAKFSWKSASCSRRSPSSRNGPWSGGRRC